MKEDRAPYGELMTRIWKEGRADSVQCVQGTDMEGRKEWKKERRNEGRTDTIRAPHGTNIEGRKEGKSEARNEGRTDTVRTPHGTNLERRKDGHPTGTSWHEYGREEGMDEDTKE